MRKLIQPCEVNSLPNTKHKPFQRSIWDALSPSSRKVVNYVKDRCK